MTMFDILISNMNVDEAANYKDKLEAMVERFNFDLNETKNIIWPKENEEYKQAIAN